MPTYDYICDGCAHEFEAYESIKSDPQKACPECKTDRLRRKIGAGAAILFKGSGFYQTDYRSESYKSAAKAEEANGKTATPAATPAPAATPTPATTETTGSAKPGKDKSPGKNTKS